MPTFWPHIISELGGVGWATYQKEIYFGELWIFLYTYKYELRQNAAGYPDQACYRVGESFIR